MRTNENGPSGVFHPTTAYGIILQQERAKREALDEIDFIWQDEVRRVTEPRCAPALTTRTRDQIAEAQAKLEENRVYYKLNAEGALVPISK
jgi:hypothetical protein